MENHQDAAEPDNSKGEIKIHNMLDVAQLISIHLTPNNNKNENSMQFCYILQQAKKMNALNYYVKVTQYHFHSSIPDK